MAIRGITFSKQSVSSNDDAHLNRVLLGGGDGVTRGCKMTHGTDNIFISEGYFLIAGRLVEIPSSETISTAVISSGTSYCRLVFEIDLSKQNTNTEFLQGTFKILTSSTAYPEITQEDLEDGGNVYQLSFAKFTKSVSGIGNFVSELKSIGINNANNSIYVSKSGNDSSGDGSESLPFATIQHAIESISKNLNNKEIYIVVASGTYAEDVKISGFYGGMLRIHFNNATINSLTINDTNVTLAGTNLTIAKTTSLTSVYINNGANVICQVPITITGGLAGLQVNNGSRFIATQDVTINTTLYAVLSENASIVYIYNLKGSGSETGVLADSSFVILNSIAANIANTQYATESGGRIYTGSQAGVPNY